MDKLCLVFPDISLKDDVEAYRQEFYNVGSSMDGCGGLVRTPEIEEWIQAAKAKMNRSTVPEGHVQATQFICVRESDNRIIGMIQVRHYLNEYLSQFGGHIGYSVRPSERKKGYATEMLSMVLPFCRELGFEKILITCINNNVASRKVILTNGGVYESTVYSPEEDINLERYWINLK